MGQRISTGILGLKQAMTRSSIVLIAILALTFYLRLLYFGQTIDGDVGNLGYLAWRMAEGEVLLDLEGPGKPPLYFMVYSMFIRLLGPSVLMLKMFGTISVLLAVLAVYWLAHQAYGKQVGLLAALLFGVFSSGPMIEGGGVNLETVMHLPYILATGLFLRASMSGRLRWYFLTGLCAALATLVKQVGGVLFLVFLCYGIYEWWKKPPPLSRNQLFCRYVLLVTGALVPMIGILFFYRFQGYHLDQLYDSMLGSNLRYIHRGYQYTDFLKNVSSSGKFIFPENGLLWFGTLFTSVYLGWRIWRNKEAPADRLLLWWSFWSFAVLCIVGTFFAHYFLQVIAPFSVVTAYGIIAAWRGVKSLSPVTQPVARGAWALLLGVAMILFIRTDYKYFFTYTPEEQTIFQYKGSDHLSREYGLYNLVQQGIASYIQARTDPTETIYVWGISPQIYFLAQRRAATRYRNNYNMSQLVTDDGQKALMAYAPLVMEDIRRSHPAYIVEIFPLEDFPDLYTLVQKNYTMDTDIGFFLPSFTIRLYRKCRDIGVTPDPE